jgi:hypothetical protein
VIGVDFDNTIVCYDDLFHGVAVEQGMIPASVAASKGEVRAYLEERGQGDTWTKLQGYVYGARLPAAVPFSGVVEFFRRSVAAGVPVCIISHKTRYPALGPAYDLHEAAQQWLEMQGFYDPARIGLARDRVYFELTQEAKVNRIAEVGCAIFIDDLPDVLMRPEFPSRAQRILFDPHRQYAAEKAYHHTSSWSEIEQVIRWSQRSS